MSLAHHRTREKCPQQQEERSKQALTPCWSNAKSYHVPAADVPQVDHHIHLWGPQVDLPLPGRQRGERHDQQEGSVQLVLVEQVVEEADRLDGFAQTHLVGQDAAVASVEKKKTKKTKRFKLMYFCLSIIYIFIFLIWDQESFQSIPHDNLAAKRTAEISVAA